MNCTPTYVTLSHRHGFTLIELLVVISIIVVLLAMLAPSLDQAIGAAEAVSCGSNQRVMSRVFAQYGDDHRRVWVAPWDMGAGNVQNNWQWQWPYIIAFYAIPGHGPVTNPPAQAGTIAPFTGSKTFTNHDSAKMMFCPTLWGRGIYFNAPVLQYTNFSYAITAKYNDVYHLRGYPSPRRMKNPSMTLHLSDMVLADKGGDPNTSASYLPWSAPFKSSPNAPGDPHARMSNYLFADGRVERLAQDRIEDDGNWRALD